MKISSQTIKAVFFISTLLIATISCDMFSGDDPLPGGLGEVLENTGAEFSFKLLQPFDLLDGKDAFLRGMITVNDFENDNSAEAVFIYLYTLNIQSEEIYLNVKDDPVQIYKIALDELEPYEGSIPGATPDIDGLSGFVTIPLTVIIDNLPVDIEIDQLSAGDSINIQWRVLLSNGQEATVPCPFGGVSVGLRLPAFCTPLFFNYSLPEGAFTGLYTFTQLDSSSLSVSGFFPDNPQLFSEMQFEAELTPEPQLGGVVRQFNATYLDFLGYNLDQYYPLKFDEATGSVTMNGNRPTGLSCSPSHAELTLGPETESLSSYDMEDDSEFIMALTDNIEGDCGSPPVQVRFLVEKSE